MQSIAQQLNNVRESIHKLEQKYDREKASVRLLAVSKTRSSQEILEIAREGQKHFGENYQQEALIKINDLRDEDICWHFIGPLQSNKAKGVAENFDWIHSLDRLKLAQRLSRLRPASMPPINTCIQVNISEESTKSGVDAGQLFDFAAEVADLPGIKLRGLMALPAPVKELELQREQCSRLRELYEELGKQGHQLDTLSMGTTSDMEAAIAEGSTMVRIGTAIFGPRK